MPDKHIERLTRSKFCGGSAAAPAATLKAEKAIGTRGPSPLSLQISPFVIYISLANNDAFLQVKTDIICYDTKSHAISSRHFVMYTSPNRNRLSYLHAKPDYYWKNILLFIFLADKKNPDICFKLTYLTLRKKI